MAGRITIDNLSDSLIRLLSTDMGYVEENLQEIFNIVNNIEFKLQNETTLKNRLVDVLVALGIDCDTNTELGELFSIISNLKVSYGGDAVASDVISGKTFTNAEGELITGTMVNQGSKTITPSASTQTLPAGYYEGITINGDNDLTAANIRSGKNIFGVTGTGNFAKSITASSNKLDEYSGYYKTDSTIGYTWTSEYSGTVNVYISGEWASNYVESTATAIVAYKNGSRITSLGINGGYDGNSNGEHYYKKTTSVSVVPGDVISFGLSNSSSSFSYYYVRVRILGTVS